MVLERKRPMKQISADRLKEFGGVMPFNSLQKPGGAAKPSWKPKQWVDTGPDDETVQLILARDEWKCCCCGDPLYGDRGSGWCISHRVLRAHGVNNLPSNLYASCMDCERQTHAHPAKSYDAGYMVLSTDDPETVVFEHAQGARLLLNDGSVVVIQATRKEDDEYADPF